MLVSYKKLRNIRPKKDFEFQVSKDIYVFLKICINFICITVTSKRCEHFSTMRFFQKLNLFLSLLLMQNNTNFLISFYILSFRKKPHTSFLQSLFQKFKKESLNIQRLAELIKRKTVQEIFILKKQPGSSRFENVSFSQQELFKQIFDIHLHIILSSSFVDFTNFH